MNSEQSEARAEAAKPTEARVQIDPRVMSLLVCPACLGELRVEADRLVCVACGREYPVVDGIPVLTAPSD